VTNVAEPAQPLVGHLVERIGYRFSDAGLLDQALSHRSWCAEQGGVPSNERLEFLGDAVLGLVVADHTYGNYPDLAEGGMAKVRASVVNTRVLAEVAAEIDLGPHLRLGRGEDSSGGRAKESILADAIEAVIGAVYLDGGYEEARRLIYDLLATRIELAIAGPGAFDFKSRLQEESVRTGLGVPRYEMESRGPDHARRYVATVYVADQHLGVGEGRSKKDAEQAAAQAAVGAMGDERGGRDA
jgi:ribonuclease-3